MLFLRTFGEKHFAADKVWNYHHLHKRNLGSSEKGFGSNSAQWLVQATKKFGLDFWQNQVFDNFMTYGLAISKLIIIGYLKMVLSYVTHRADAEVTCNAPFSRISDKDWSSDSGVLFMVLVWSSSDHSNPRWIL